MGRLPSKTARNTVYVISFLLSLLKTAVQEDMSILNFHCDSLLPSCACVWNSKLVLLRGKSLGLVRFSLWTPTACSRYLVFFTCLLISWCVSHRRMCHSRYALFISLLGGS